AASTSSGPASRRKSVTVVTDTGQVPWKDLTYKEKAARTTQQSFNLTLILVGAAMTVGVATVLYLEVFSSDSKTAVFNRAADRVRADPRCIEMLSGGRGHNVGIEAYGEPSWSRWARNRTIASRHEKDAAGVEHTHLHFYVRASGSDTQGTVNVHVSRQPGRKDWEYRLMSLDVPNHATYYLEGSTAEQMKQGVGKVFGIQW
ncbi:TIM21-domain-containing protein, partial [Piedraia hortae CBS 480.64]